MIHRRFHIDVRRVDQARQRLEARLRHGYFDFFSVGKGANANGIAVRGDHRHGFANVLRGDAVHDDTVADFESVNRHVGRDHEGTAAETRHRGLE